MKSDKILKNAMILFVIAVVLSALLGIVNEITKDRIAEQNQLKKETAYKKVCQEAASIPEDADLKAIVEQSSQALKDKGFEGIEINDARPAKDASGNVIAYALDITTANGYGGDINMSLGIGTDGTVTGLEIISNSETAGLGANCAKDTFKGQFAGKKSEELTYVKTGDAGDDEINAISSATITTKAVTGAVNAGLYFAYECIGVGK
ncbi:RnfABCDGE type electron transport complex subunit G [Cuneatibacter sp. NSJ-177]|uniref:RnfABCDGE type electron transport complex subunit G n=1 Tax=Cuneatibacter sp. NSJ-177 TaxID=2931401 RepID=UPI001FD0FF6B|nr:RnfABCDGE type electron transport complex subunit G [Cuneatibacter sp. NSJ-177]MCJ7834137.1 RnfABCDGE type electron transport complex subunit G [Cuneatibacter sp. NSJ-177]